MNGAAPGKLPEAVFHATLARAKDFKLSLTKNNIFPKIILTNAEKMSIISFVYRGIAQLVEYWSPKPWVVGSSPSAPAMKKRFCLPTKALFLMKSPPTELIKE